MKLFSVKKIHKHTVINIIGIKISVKTKQKDKLPIQDNFYDVIYTFFYKYLVMPFVLFKNSKKKYRALEIGPGNQRIPLFEGINIVKNAATDYIADVAKGIPLKSSVFDLIYSSHFLEHIEWYKTEFVLKEIYKILKPGGTLELWVPDGLKICKSFVDAELHNDTSYCEDNWWRFNDEHDPCIWANGRIFTYGNGKHIKGHWNSHLALFSERYLVHLLEKVGFTEIRKMSQEENRIKSHSYINLGIMAKK